MLSLAARLGALTLIAVTPALGPTAMAQSISQSIAQKPAANVMKAPDRPANMTRVEKAPPAPQRTQAGAKPVDASVKTLVSLYARRHGVPERLAHRIVAHESRYNPALKGRAHYGLMQISLPTARQMGYSGQPQGLFDARTNLAHGMPYLANAWIVSGGSEARAMSLYTRGYYNDAKRKGLTKSLRNARSAPVEPVEAEAVANAD